MDVLIQLWVPIHNMYMCIKSLIVHFKYYNFICQLYINKTKKHCQTSFFTALLWFCGPLF